MNKKILVIMSVLVLLSTPFRYIEAQNTPRVRMETNHGVIIFELNPEAAPKTVENFLTYVEQGFFDGTIFHRVIKGFMIQGGGFTPDMKRKPTDDPIPNEANNNLKNQRGTIAMARTGEPHSATSQFFINTVDNASLDFKEETPRGWGYCVFGKVIKGMEVVDSIESVQTTTKGSYKDVPASPVVIEKVTIEEEVTKKEE